MRKLTLFMHTTLDGFIATTDNDIGIFDVGEEMMPLSHEVFGAMGGIVFSRNVYGSFVDYWDKTVPASPSSPPGEREFSRIFCQLQRIVVSRSSGKVGENAVRIGSDLGPELTAIKQQPGKDLILIAGPELATACAELDLIDNLIVNIFPIVLGTGVPLFGELSTRRSFNLLSSRKFPSGVVSQRLDMLPSSHTTDTFTVTRSS